MDSPKVEDGKRVGSREKNEVFEIISAFRSIGDCVV